MPPSVVRTSWVAQTSRPPRFQELQDESESGNYTVRSHTHTHTQIHSEITPPPPPTHTHTYTHTQAQAATLCNGVCLGLARTIYIRCMYCIFWLGNHQIYGHIRRTHTVLANPKHAPQATCTHMHTCACTFTVTLLYTEHTQDTHAHTKRTITHTHTHTHTHAVSTHSSRFQQMESFKAWACY